MGGPELAAAAAMLNASITCFLTSANGLDERRFAPPPPEELQLGAVEADAGAEEGGRGGRVGLATGECHFCLVTAGRFFWSTRRGREWDGREGPVPSMQAESIPSPQEDACAAATEGAQGNGAELGGDTAPRDSMVDKGAAETQESPEARMEPCIAKLECAAVNARRLGGGDVEEDQEEEEEEDSDQGRVQMSIMAATSAASHAASEIEQEEVSITKIVGGDVASWPGYGEGAATEREGRARKFSSRYSPLFLKCIVDVEAKFAADGLLPLALTPSCVLGLCWRGHCHGAAVLSSLGS